MVHGYHVIFGAYGFWLPNDPRGSWSDFVFRWELVRFGRATKSSERHELSAEDEAERQTAKQAMKYAAVQFSGVQAHSIGQGFEKSCRLGNFTVWACAILPEHTHLVIARHTYKVEQIASLLKGEATKQLRHDGLDPFASVAVHNKPAPSPWAEKRWKVFLDTEEAVENAIRYVEENPLKEGKPKQKWSFVKPFTGLNQSSWITYH
jgi:REP element-mobilizing transposase RayT